MSELGPVLERIATALERLADQRDTLMSEAQTIEIEEPLRSLTPGEVIDVVSAVIGLDILKRDRGYSYVWGRNAAYTAMRERLHLSMPIISKFFDYDHTTILSGLARFRQREIWRSWDHERWTEIERILDTRQEPIIHAG